MATGQAPQRKPQEVVYTGPENEQPPDTALADAIAEHFGIEANDLSGFIVTAEYNHAKDGEAVTTLSSAWSVGVPAWRLRGFVAEAAKQMESI